MLAPAFNPENPLENILITLTNKAICTVCGHEMYTGRNSFDPTNPRDLAHITRHLKSHLKEFRKPEHANIGFPQVPLFNIEKFDN